MKVEESKTPGDRKDRRKLDHARALLEEAGFRVLSPDEDRQEQQSRDRQHRRAFSTAPTRRRVVELEVRLTRVHAMNPENVCSAAEALLPPKRPLDTIAFEASIRQRAAADGYRSSRPAPRSSAFANCRGKRGPSNDVPHATEIGSNAS